MKKIEELRSVVFGHFMNVSWIFFSFFLMLTGSYAVLLGNTLDFWNLREQVLQIHKIIKPNIKNFPKIEFPFNGKVIICRHAIVDTVRKFKDSIYKYSLVCQESLQGITSLFKSDFFPTS